MDTHKRDNTRIRKSDLAIATETYQNQTPPTQTQEPKPQLMHFVASKTVREYKRNREKIRKFCLEEKRQFQRDSSQKEEQDNRVHHNPPEEMAGTSNLQDTEVTSQQAGPSTATVHQIRQQRKQTSSQKTTSVQKQRERKRKNISPSKKTIRPTKNKPSHLDQKSKEAALAQTRKKTTKKEQSKTTITSPYGSYHIPQLKNNQDYKPSLGLIGS